MLITVDFIEVALKNCVVDDLIKFLGFQNIEFLLSGTYNRFYSKSYRLNKIGVIIGFDNNSTIYDCYLHLSGTGCRFLEDCNPDLNWLNFFISLISKFDCDFRRIDIAIDDFSNILRPSRMWSYYISRKYAGSCNSVPDFRQGRSDQIVFGSTKSDFLVRVYNKALERGFDTGDLITNEYTGEVVNFWYRCELQIRSYKANQFINQFIMIGDIGLCSKGYLFEFIRFLTKSNDKKNSQRIPVASWWLEFIGDVERIKFTSRVGSQYNKHKLESFLFNQCSSSISTYCYVNDLTADELYNRFNNDNIKFSADQLALMRAYKDYKESIKCRWQFDDE